MRQRFPGFGSSSHGYQRACGVDGLAHQVDMEQSNRIERRERLRGWERTGQEDCRPGTDSTKAEARGATVATAEAEAATDHWHGERTAWASANERAGVTAEEIQRSAAQRSVVQCSAREQLEANGRGQRAASRWNNAVRCRRGQRSAVCGGNGRTARGGEGARW